MNRILSLSLAALASLVLASCNRPTTQSASGDQVVARIGNQTITMAEVDKAAGTELFEVRERALENLITERVLEPEAKKAGLSLDQYLRKLVEAKVPDVTEAEAADFFAKNQARLGEQFAGKKFEDVKPIIVQGLTGQKRQEAVGGVIEDVKARAGVKILLQQPKVQVAAVGPSKGPANAKVTIVEFSDFQCPFCSKGKQVIDRVLKEYDGKVRVVFRDFPLSFHENAEKAAEAGQCANEQNKFWEMHDWMFDNQKSLGVDDLKGAAKKLGMDPAKFDQCLSSGKYAQAVAENMKAGQQAGVKGTPGFFVNGTFLNGALPFEKFKTEIDRALGQ